MVHIMKTSGPMIHAAMAHGMALPATSGDAKGMTGTHDVNEARSGLPTASGSNGQRRQAPRPRSTAQSRSMIEEADADRP